MEKIAILGSSNALKPKIILETLIKMNVLLDKQLILFTDKNSGICVDFCREKDIKFIVFENNKLDDDHSLTILEESGAELLISAGWPKKIPSSFLKGFSYTPINCHGSILPDYRGSRAYMHYWANCEDYYGATIHYMNERFDDGNIIVQGKLKSFTEENPSIVHRRTAELCAYLIPTAILLVQSGYEGKSQVGQKRYFNKLSPEEFKQYREYNLGKDKREIKLTPHKIID